MQRNDDFILLENSHTEQNILNKEKIAYYKSVSRYTSWHLNRAIIGGLNPEKFIISRKKFSEITDFDYFYFEIIDAESTSKKYYLFDAANDIWENENNVKTSEYFEMTSSKDYPILDLITEPNLYTVIKKVRESKAFSTNSTLIFPVKEMRYFKWTSHSRMHWTTYIIHNDKEILCDPKSSALLLGILSYPTDHFKMINSTFQQVNFGFQELTDSNSCGKWLSFIITHLINTNELPKDKPSLNQLNDELAANIQYCQETHPYKKMFDATDDKNLSSPLFELIDIPDIDKKNDNWIILNESTQNLDNNESKNDKNIIPEKIRTNANSSQLFFMKKASDIESLSQEIELELTRTIQSNG